MNSNEVSKPLAFIGDSQRKLKEFPKDVKVIIGQALRTAQRGYTHADSKPLKGFKGAGVLEIVADYDGDTYRGVYTVKLAGVIYVLHCFQKKSKSGIKTPLKEVELVKKRLKVAKEHYNQFFI